MIRLLTFDLDNTLWETEPVVVAAEARLLEWLAEHAPLFVRNLDAEARRALRHEVLTAEPLLRHRVTALRIAILELGLRKAGYAEEHARELALQGFEVFLEARHALTFFPHAEALLGRLAKRYQLATISNGNADVKRLGLQDFFKVIVSADEVGVGKPDPAPFLAALERAGAEPHETLHIGDHPVDDIQGAQGVGLHTLWFNRMQLPWPDQPRPHGEVKCLSEVESWLESYLSRLESADPSRS
ncbi:putative hydrolase of the HAD superfamily [Halopseudomonas xinjiangensis]|uniref:Putative hydrolase of the HAD superfamily n=1 Tax=Halopseudomonas xinjiangensis TaxID=487184 RepID=A0A1H1YBF5_9GAMM|nr:HAD family hydrolase [Halopseudomonas xinjiangensis]SDT18757.1 putative hydrolase of the HAD superfamily [Halopseudomonas xinjiangensis]